MSNFPTIWKGKQFELTRLLLLGESAYSWMEGDEEVQPSDRHAHELAEWEIKETGCIRFTTLISRALTGLETPTSEQRQMAWDRIAFANFVPTAVGSGSRAAPDQRHVDLGQGSLQASSGRACAEACRGARKGIVGKHARV